MLMSLLREPFRPLANRVKGLGSEEEEEDAPLVCRLCHEHPLYAFVAAPSTMRATERLRAVALDEDHAQRLLLVHPAHHCLHTIVCTSPIV